MDKKITELDAVVTPTDADLLTTVTNLSTTPANKKITWTVAKAFLKTYFDGLYADVLGADDNYVTDAEKIVIGNTSGENTGDQDLSTLATLAGAETLTNKRITERVKTFTSDATPDVNADDYDAVTITAQAVAITDVNMSGTPTNFQKLIFRIKDNGTARALTFGSDFEAKGVDLPTTTIASKVMTLGFIYDSVSEKWGLVAYSVES